MGELPSNEGQRPSEQERPVVKARWNEGFKLPGFVLPESLGVIKNSQGNIPVFECDLEVDKDGKIITGKIKIAAYTRMITDPWGAIGQGAASASFAILQPAGSPPVEFRVIKKDDMSDYRQDSAIEVTKLPLVLSVSTDPSKSNPNHRGIEYVRHYLRYGGNVVDGGSNRISLGTITGDNGWDEGDRVLLPFDPTVFEELELTVGDTAPQLPTT